MRHSTSQYDGYYELGYVLRTHGVKGDVIILLDTDAPDRYRKLKSVFLEQHGSLEEFEVSTVVIQPDEKSARLHLKGIEDMTPAEALLKRRVFIPLTFLPPLRGKEFYFHEIIGYTVVDKTAGELGPLLTVYDLLQHPVGEVERESKKIMFPLIDEFIETINRKEKKIYISLPDGLIDVYL